MIYTLSQMIEVFITNVKYRKQAKFLLKELLTAFPTYRINFDLDDCDNILRVESRGEPIKVRTIQRILNELGFEAVVLPDEVITQHTTSVP